MKVRRITANVYEIPLGYVNVFIIEDEELTLIDTGVPGQAGRILDAVRHIGRSPEDIAHILLTHSHPDHAGNVAELQQRTGAKVYMHPAEAPLVELGEIPKPGDPKFTGLMHKLLYNMMIKNAPGKIKPVVADEMIVDSDWLPMAGGIHVIHVPGHSAGQLAFFLPGQKNVLFVADAAMNLFGLGYSAFYEDLVEAAHSLERLSTFDFDIACFGHGRSLLHEAANRFRNKFLKPLHKAARQPHYVVLEQEHILRIQEPE